VKQTHMYTLIFYFLEAANSTDRLAAWRSGNAFHSINEVTLRRAGLALGWMTACGQVNQPPRSTQPSIPPG